MPVTQDYRPCAMHEQGTQIDIAPFGNAQLPDPSTCASLSGHQSGPGGELSAGFEGFGFANAGDCRSCGQQPHAGDFGHCLTGWGIAQNGGETAFDGGDLLVYAHHPRPLFAQAIEQHSGQMRIQIGQGGRQCLRQGRMALGQYFSEFIQQSPQGVGLHDPELQQLGAQSMQGQDGLLGLGLRRDEASVRLLRRRPDGPRVGGIGLVAQHERPHALRVQQAHLVPQCGKLPRPPVGAQTADKAPTSWGLCV